MSDNRAFLIYLDYEEHFKQITHEQVGELIMGMIAYSKTGIVPKFSDGAVSMAFSFMKSQLDRDSDAYRRKCEINQENGKHGGRPRNNRTVSEKTERFSEKPKKTERLIPKPKNPIQIQMQIQMQIRRFILMPKQLKLFLVRAQTYRCRKKMLRVPVKKNRRTATSRFRTCITASACHCHD